MDDADMIICELNNGNIIINDYYSNAMAYPNLDTKLGG